MSHLLSLNVPYVSMRKRILVLSLLTYLALC